MSSNINRQDTSNKDNQVQSLNIDRLDINQKDIPIKPVQKSDDFTQTETFTTGGKKVLEKDTISPSLNDPEIAKVLKEGKIPAKAAFPQLVPPGSEQWNTDRIAKAKQTYSNPDVLDPLFHQEFEKELNARSAPSPKENLSSNTQNGANKTLNPKMKGQLAQSTPTGSTVIKQKQDDVGAKPESFGKESTTGTGSTLSLEQQALVRYAHYNPTKPVDPKTQELLDQLNSTASTFVKQKQAEVGAEHAWSPPKEDSGEFGKTAYAGFFTGAMAVIDKQEPPLTEKQLAEITFAYHYPDEASTEGLDLLKKLGIDKEVSQLLLEKGIAAPQSPKHTMVFDEKVAVSYNQKYQQNLQAFAEKKGLSEEQVQKLTYQHFNPEANFPESEQLKNMNAELEAEAFTQIQEEHALPAGWKILEDNSAKRQFNTKFNGAYQFENDVGFDHFVAANPLMKKSEALQLKHALANPEASGVSETIKAEAEKIRKKSADKVRDIRYKGQLPKNWAPTATPLWMGDQTQFKALKVLGETVKTVQSLSEKVPGFNNNDNSMLNYLKAVSEALIKMQESTFSSQQKDMESSREITKAQTEERNDQLALREKQEAEMAAKRKEIADAQSAIAFFANILKPFGIPVLAIVGIVGTLITIASLGTLGPAVVAIVVSLTLVTVADQIYSWAASDGEGFLAKGVKAMAQKAGDQLGGAVGKAIAVILVMIAAAVLIKSAAPLAIILPFFLQNFGIVSDISAQAGASEITQMIIDSSVQMMCIVLIAAYAKASHVEATLGNFIKALTAKLTAAIASLTRSIEATANTLLKGLGKAFVLFLQALELFLKAISKRIIGTGFDLTVATLKWKGKDAEHDYWNLSGDAKHIQGELDTNNQSARAYVRARQNAVDAFLQLQAQFADVTKETNDVIMNMYRKAGEETTRLASSA